MTLKERISDLFEKYSVQLEVEEKAEVKFAVATLDSGQEIQTDAEAFAVDRGEARGFRAPTGGDARAPRGVPRTASRADRGESRGDRSLEERHRASRLRFLR